MTNHQCSPTFSPGEFGHAIIIKYRLDLRLQDGVEGVKRAKKRNPIRG